jgi:hypothetical protein
MRFEHKTPPIGIDERMALKHDLPMHSEGLRRVKQAFCYPYRYP